jgi:hypothetical protein
MALEASDSCNLDYVEVYRGKRHFQLFTGTVA